VDREWGDEGEQVGFSARHTRGAMAGAAFACVDELERRGELNPQPARVLRRRYQRRKDRLARGRSDMETKHDREMARQLSGSKQEILDLQRSTLIGLRNRGQIGNVVLRHLQLMLDMEQVQLDERSHPQGG
jgi:hypothetical protein